MGAGFKKRPCTLLRRFEWPKRLLAASTEGMKRFFTERLTNLVMSVAKLLSAIHSGRRWLGSSALAQTR